MNIQIDGKLFMTERAQQHWDEAKDHDGSNFIGRSSGSQWRDDTLYKSKKGTYYLVTDSRVSGEHSRGKILTPLEAAQWLLLNDEELPEDLKPLNEEAAE
jgi:hypothetical protein